MHIVGKTEDGRHVIGDLFKMHDENGVPLSLSLMFLHNANKVADLAGFLNDALDAGWSYNSTVTRIREAVIDVFGKADWVVIEKKLEQTFELRCHQGWLGLKYKLPPMSGVSIQARIPNRPPIRPLVGMPNGIEPIRHHPRRS